MGGKRERDMGGKREREREREIPFLGKKEQKSQVREDVRRERICLGGGGLVSSMF